jgi:hypothetical protein
MGLLSLVLDHDSAVYILTLGVVDGWRGRGIASRLIRLVTQYAAETRWAAWRCACSFLYAHVCLCLCVCVCVYVCVCMHVSARVLVCVCLRACVFVHVSGYVCIYARTHVPMPRGRAGFVPLIPGAARSSSTSSPTTTPPYASTHTPASSAPVGGCAAFGMARGRAAGGRGHRN